MSVANLLFFLQNIIIVTALVVVFVIVSGVSILPNILFVAIVALCKVGLAAQIKSCDIFSEIGRFVEMALPSFVRRNWEDQS